MALVPLKGLLQQAMAGEYAIGGFDTGEHGFAEAIIQAAEELNTPVILMVPEAFFRLIRKDSFFSYLVPRIKASSAQIDLHLDHGTSYEICLQAIHHGFSSVMIDGSLLSYEQNVALTKKVVEAAHAAGVSVEAELGHVGGTEATIMEGTMADDRFFTDPDEAVEFVQETGVDALAISFGTVHGVYQGAPKLDLDRLSIIRRRLSIPLVMHGGSGLSNDDFRNVIACGISKVNYFTDVSRAAVGVMKRKLEATDGKIFYPELIALGLEEAKAVIKRQIEVFGTKPLN